MSLPGNAVRRRAGLVALAPVLALFLASGAAAQEEDFEDVFGELGTATQEDEAAEPQADAGIVAGRVFDGESGAPIANATVILIWPDPGDGSEPRQDVQVSAGDGSYEFPPVPAGAYTLSFIKAGYRASNLEGFEVVANEVKRADFPMPPAPTAPGGEILELEAFVVDEAAVGEMMDALEIRLESDQLLDILSAEDLSKFAASDVAEALKRVAGVNVVEGQFAIIRGLEERYSSTLFNGAPVPSPDPDRQSVQLDLFPSDIVSDLEIAKTFAPDSPSNSSGGSLDISTTGYPDTWTVAVSGGTGFNDQAWDEFLAYRSDGGGGGPTPIGKPEDGSDTLESDVSAFLGGRQEAFGREWRLLAGYSREIDYETLDGWEQDHEPAQQITFPPRLARPGDLALGRLGLPGARWDLTRSLYEKRKSWFVGAGLDLDRDARHRLDASVFLTRNDDESVERREGGQFPAEVYAPFLSGGRSAADQGGGNFTNLVAPTEWVGQARQDAFTSVRFGQMWYAPVYEGRTFERDRELDLFQLNGEHDLGGIALLDGLSLDWAASYATTSQSETQLDVRYFFEPDDVEFITELPGPPPVSPELLGPGLFSTRSDIVFGINEIDEEQIFGRGDLGYEFAPLCEVDVTLKGGIWYEYAERDVDSRFNTAFSGDAAEPGVVGTGTNFAIQGRAIEEMGARVFRGIGLDEPLPVRTSEGEREILAGHFGGKATLYEDLDLLAGLRLEQLRITSNNDPFTGFCTDLTPFDGVSCPAGHRPSIFPDVYVLFDRLDNPNILEEAVFAGIPGLVNNDEIVGIEVTPDPDTGFIDYRTAARIRDVVNGEIDERYELPSAGLTYRFAGLSRTRGWTRPLEGFTFRAAFSQTVARPSFRELGYYASLRSNDDTILLGNPQLQPSEVTSYDARLEYVWGDYGDLLAVSGFYKDVEDPIETVTVRDPFGQGIDTYRTFKNNPSDAELLGVEVEGRVTLGVVAGFLEPFSLGANGTYIHAEVDQPPQLRQALAPFFAVTDAERAAGLVEFDGYEKTRRLTNQPEWIANADLSFDQPDWRTKVTLAVFAISEILDATAATDYNSAGQLISFGLDRYTDSFYQLDLVASQGFALPYLPGEWTVKASLKNLTNSERGVAYDPEQTADEIAERRFRIGRDYSFSLSYEIELGGSE